jgi:type II secretory pathway component GspD/PulD (secretin)
MKRKILTFVFLFFHVCCPLAAKEAIVPAGKLNNFGTVKNISLADAPLLQVLYILEELTGKPVLRDAKLEDVTIDLQIRHEIGRDDAIRAIESALALNNVAVIELGDGMLKAVSSQAAQSQSPYFVEKSLLDEPPSEKICTKLFKLEFVSVDEFSKLVEKLLNPTVSSVIVFTDSNAILLTDSISNLQRVELIIDRIDVPVHSIVDSRIFHIKHGDAAEIAGLLHKVINGPSGGSVAAGDGGGTAPSSFKFSKNLTVEHDARSNAIVVCGTGKDIEQVRSIIDQIDVLLDQVRIEVIIAQISLGKWQASGLDSLGITFNGKEGKDEKFNTGKRELAASGKGTSVDSSAPVIDFSGNLLKNFALQTVFNKARNDSNVKILSAPTIVTTHNKEAVMKIVESLPIVKSDISDSSGTGTAMKSTIEYKDIGIELKVKPLIGTNGVIQLEISQKVEDKIGESKINGNSMPTTSRREATSFVSVCDGDTVVLAGLQERKTSNSRGKLWLLGDIPVVGSFLFSPKSKDEKRSELIIFIKPTVVSNPANEEAYAKRMLNGSAMENDLMCYTATGKFSSDSVFDESEDVSPSRRNRDSRPRAKAMESKASKPTEATESCAAGKRAEKDFVRRNWRKE